MASRRCSLRAHPGHEAVAECLVAQSVSLLAGLGVRTTARAGRAGRGRLSQCCRSHGVQAGRIVQTGAEQSLWVHILLNSGQRVPLTLWSVCVGQRNCPWHLAALGLWVTGKSPPGLCSMGREVCLLDFSSSSNHFLVVSASESSRCFLGDFACTSEWEYRRALSSGS